MKTICFLALLFSASCVYALPIDDVSLSASTDLDFANAEDAEDYSLGFDDLSANEDEDLRGGRRIRQAVKAVKKILRPPPRPASSKPVAKPAPPPVVKSRAVSPPPPVAPTVLPVSVVTHKIVRVPQTQSEKANKVATYISILNTDIDKNHKVFMDQYNAELAKLREISKKKLYTEEEYLKAQRELNAKYKIWKDTLHAFSISNSTLSSLRHHNSSFTEEKNLLTHLYEYVKMFSTKQGYYKHNCVCNATLVGDLRSVQSATSLS
jgi:hypothetical protein